MIKHLIQVKKKKVREFYRLSHYDMPAERITTFLTLLKKVFKFSDRKLNEVEELIFSDIKFSLRHIGYRTLYNSSNIAINKAAKMLDQKQR